MIPAPLRDGLNTSSQSEEVIKKRAFRIFIQLLCTHQMESNLGLIVVYYALCLLNNFGNGHFFGNN